jgi:hypothetical protein
VGTWARREPRPSYPRAAPIGARDEITEDDRGLRVRGRPLLDVCRGGEAHALLEAGAIANG